MDEEQRKFDEKRVEPMSIYEVHIGSWMKHPAEENENEDFII